jgi:hypothetical protein
VQRIFSGLDDVAGQRMTSDPFSAWLRNEPPPASRIGRPDAPVGSNFAKAMAVTPHSQPHASSSAKPEAMRAAADVTSSKPRPKRSVQWAFGHAENKLINALGQPGHRQGRKTLRID